MFARAEIMFQMKCCYIVFKETSEAQSSFTWLLVPRHVYENELELDDGFWSIPIHLHLPRCKSED